MKIYSLKVGDNVIASPSGFFRFSGIIVKIRQEGDKTIYTVRDQEDDCFDCEEEETELY